MAVMLLILLMSVHMVSPDVHILQKKRNSVIQFTDDVCQQHQSM